jgi:two-component system, chemotaxis family, sensor kinase Cph1
MANPCLTLSNEVRAVLAPYGNQAAASGKDLALAPEAALTLSLVLHELVSNAAKHGALSAPDGRVEVGWRVDEDGAAGPMFCLDWAERDGPPVVPPAGGGFGRSLIEEMPRHDLRAEVRLSFWAKGLAYALAAPLAAIVA